ncbi:RNA-dependent RNA polymerase [Grapevine emaravirus A]|nr:RNA-dependent RNA polymerase [Grapevine emaravirus A]
MSSKVLNEAVEKIRSGDAIDDDILKKFLTIFGKTKSKYTLSHRRKDVEHAYNDCIQDPNFTKDVISICERILYCPPNEHQIDIAVSMIIMLEFLRHDELMRVIMLSLQRAGYKIDACDEKIKNVFPDVNSILTPDIYFSKDGERYIAEIKVRNKYTDLKYYYNRYKDVVEQEGVYVAVFNLCYDRFVEEGDYKISEIIDTDSIFNDIIYLMKLGIDIRTKYEVYPQYTIYTPRLQSNTDEVAFIPDGYRGMFERNENYGEIKRLFGSRWTDLIDKVENFSIYENEEKVTQDLINSRNDLYQECSDSLQNFIYHYEEYVYKDKYPQTQIKNRSIYDMIDKKNMLKYKKTDKLRPSIYLPITKTIKLEDYSGNRIKFYREAFKGISCKSSERYTNAVVNLIDSIFNTVAIEILVTKDSDIDIPNYKQFLTPEFIKSINDNDKKYKQIAFLSGQSSDVTILSNNSFSISDHLMKDSKDAINSYVNKHYDPNEKNKEYLSLSDNLENIALLDKHLSKIFSSPHHCGVYANDLVSLDNDNVDNVKCGIPEQSCTKYLEHLFSMHNQYKALIALNTINSHKYRLIQSQDPGNIMIMLPNADSLKGSPLRYFIISVLDKEDVDSIEANKLLGLYHTHCKSNKYTIMISKVISLDVTRLKLLNHSFVKYSLLISHYIQFKSKIPYRVHTISWLLSQFVTISSLSITDTYKNIIMAIYSDYSNIDDLIEDKLEARPKSIGQLYILNCMLNGLMKANDQLKTINVNRNEGDFDENGKLISTGFNPHINLKLPISNLTVNNPKEIIHEAFILFYLGNKGLHGSPQEILKLYSIPYKFEKEYDEVINKYKTVIQEDGNRDNMSFSYDVMKKTAIYSYSTLLSKMDQIMKSMVDELSMDTNVMSIKQFSSTKSMVSNRIPSEEIKPVKLDGKIDIHGLETFIDTSKIVDAKQFTKELNAEINRINTDRLRSSKSSLASLLEPLSKEKGITLLPSVYYEFKNGNEFIRLNRLHYSKLVNGEYVKQSNAKVFDEFYRITEESKVNVLKNMYNEVIHESDLNIRIFYKDQRTYEDREIYTGNAQTRLSLYVPEKIYKAINKFVPNEAITISGDQKQRKMLDQRIAVLKKMKFSKKSGSKSDLLSVSSDASKWSARDVFLKFFVTIACNPYMYSSEKWFIFYLFSRYYGKKILLTDNAYNDLIRLACDGKHGIYEEMTTNYQRNWFKVRSNWLQGNLNMLSSYVHYCSTLYTELMLDVFSKEAGVECVMTSMVHSDDSTYDFLFIQDSQSDKSYRDMISKQNVGRFIISLLTFSNKKHCITLNEKKTYISRFYKEFLSTTIVSNELFFFYMADLLPIASDTTYKSPHDDLASYSGFINNAFSHACPYNIIKTAITLINHLILSTYNLQYTSKKNPRHMIDTSDLPIQIYPRYKLKMDFAGTTPYYSSDAINILEDMLLTLDKYKDIKHNLIEDVINKDSVQSYLNKIAGQEKKINYLKSCMLCMDYTQYDRDDEDPYNIIDYDLSQKSIINLVSLNKGQRLKKTYTYNEYLKNEKDIRLKTSINPLWCVSKPKDLSDVKVQILSNYSNPIFKDSLIYSTPAIDYGRRVISSNRNVYKLTNTVEDKGKAKSITDVYGILADKINNLELDADSIIRYLSVYLLSDKKLSLSVQVYYSKQKVLVMSKMEAIRVVAPRSVFSEEFGRYSNTTMFDELLLNDFCELEFADSKVQKFVSICTYVLNRIGDLKIYSDPEDIDDDYINYYNFKYLDKLPAIHIKPIDNLDEWGFEAYKNKIKMMSLLVRYFNDTQKAIDEKDYDIPSYPSPSSLIMTIDSLMKKDQISSKVYLSTTQTDRYDQYLLSRYGFYADPDVYTKFKLGYKIRVSTSNLMQHDIRKEKSVKEPLAFLTKLIVNDKEIYSDLMQQRDQFIIGHYTYNDLIKDLKLTTDINSTSYLHMTGEIDYRTFMRTLSTDNRVYNMWPVRHGDVEDDDDASLALYMCRGNILSVKTISIGNAVNFVMNYYKFLNTDYNNTLDQILRKVASDYHEQFRRAIIHPKPNINKGLNCYINQYGRLCNRNDVVRNNISNISVQNILGCETVCYEQENNIFTSLKFKTQTGDITFDIKNRIYIDPDFYIETLLENIELSPDNITYHLCSSNYLINHKEYFDDIYPYMGTKNYSDLMNHTKVFVDFCSNIDVMKYVSLYNIGNFYKKNGFKDDILCKLTDCLEVECLMAKVNLNKIEEPTKLLSNLHKIKFTTGYYDNLYNVYNRNEKSPYKNLLYMIASSSVATPKQKIICMIISILKFYTDTYSINQDDDDIF